MLRASTIVSAWVVMVGLAAPSAWAARETIVLRDGHELLGEVVLEKANAIYVDLGFDVVRVPRDQIVRRGEPLKGVGRSIGGLAASVSDEDPTGFFATGALKGAVSVKELVNQFGEAVISIETPGGKGSGFILNDQGYALTNAHVIEGETKIAAIYYKNTPSGLSRGRIDDVEIVAVNPFIDLALIKVPRVRELKLRHVVLGNPEDVNAGDGVFAIGNPLGLERSVSQGIVSNRNRNFEGLVFLQTDAAINPGNSGGPLFNLRGEVVGVTNMGARGMDNLGFAIPMSYVKDFLKHRDVFSYDKDNPNTGYRYLNPPGRKTAAPPVAQTHAK